MNDHVEIEHNKKGNKSSILLIIAIILVLVALFFYVPYREKKIKEEQIKDYLVERYGFERNKIILVEHEDSNFIVDYIVAFKSGSADREHIIKYEGVEFIVKEKSYGSVSSYEDDYPGAPVDPVVNDTNETNGEIDE